ncbi:carboxypeptidase-like regulatory domain-containing protein [Winogradskyella sp. 3972H.M.0a.05]|uniref:alpha-2-macroglobulin family protein n=1 Tax=Winogradskyella sp. 3972H.M.0a.05 TaxID=2950277 RepID=UPI0033944F1A
MKHYLHIFMIVLFASFSQAQENYDSLWEEVEKLELEGLPKSALKIVESIDSKAKNEANKPQQIKALLYKSKFALTLEEDSQLSIVNTFKSEIEANEVPIKNVLENMLATLYWQYFELNRWKFYRRTNTDTKIDENDFRTWDLQTLFNEVNLHYQKSLENGLILKQERLEDYDLLLRKASRSKVYRPTLYDLLAHNALEFYKSDENSITKPAYQFKIDVPQYLSDSETFMNLNIESKDSSSLQLNALKLYQNLIKFHDKDKEKHTLAEVDIERLKFVHQYATFDNKTELLLDVLKAKSEQYKDLEASASYNFEIASNYFQIARGSTYNSKKHRWILRDALEICNSVKAKFPNTRDAKNCEVLKQKILSESLDIINESYVPVDKPSRLLVNYRNVNQLNFEAYKVTIAELKQIHNINKPDNKLDFFKSKTPVETWQANLKNEYDYHAHSTEVVIPRLDHGVYVILAKTNTERNTFALSSIHVTDLALVEKNEIKKHVYQVIDRNNGKPVSGASVQMSYRINYNGSALSKSYTTDRYGQFSISRPSSSRYYDIKFDVTYSNQTSHFGEYYIYRSYNRDRRSQKKQYQSFLFTDRSIYRPGQTVYFKGIFIEREDNTSKLVVDETVFATLFNTNGEQIAELEFDTNDFGSFNGEFILPAGGLNGQYYIQVYSTLGSLKQNFHFSVEEYKRPKFETKFEPITETYKVNDSITVKGTALAYAGSNITDAKVVYRVHRKVQYPRWYFWSRSWFVSEPQEITFGETTTDDSGNFEIVFPALPDDSVDKAGLPVFQYEVSADVTDINGETRSATTIVNVGYHAMTANMSLTSRIDKTKKDHKLSIDTRNLNGQEVPATGTIKIYKLKAPNAVLRERAWSAPDYQEIPEEEFKRLFPNEAYTNEHLPKFWGKGDLVFNVDFNTEDSKEIALGKLKKWTSGLYVVVLESKDRFGQDVKDEVRTVLYSDDDKTLADNQLFDITTNKVTYKPGEAVVLTMGSAGNTFVTLQVEKDHKTIDTQIIELSNNKKSITIPVTEDDRGGFVIHYSFAAYNGFRNGRKSISVPYPKTDLDIETTTFRDKLQPGQEETWSFKVKGPKGDKVSAELLASMYDASLDQFRGHNWTFNPIQNPYYYSQSRFQTNNSFSTTNFRLYNLRTKISLYDIQNYDQLDWFGLHFGNQYTARRKYLRSIRNIPSTYNSSSKADIESGTVKGVVKDETGLALPGANVIIKDTTTGTQTDFDGNFEIKVEKGSTLVVSYLGYKTLSVIISDDNYYNISLGEDSESLDEVVVAAYGIKNEKASLSAIVTSEEVVEESWAPRNADGDYFGYTTNSEKAKSYEDDEFNDFNYYRGNKTLEEQKEEQTSFDNIKIRKNLQETAFFFPTLRTDEDGNVSFNFTTPEALTKWKLQLLAHTKTLESATTSLETVTQKELMVIPNAPRFLRQGDRIVISTKIANLSDNSLTGHAKLELTDAVTGKALTNALIISDTSTPLSVQDFSVDAKGNTQVSWLLQIPDTVQAVQYKVLATSGDFSDGEQNALPVLTNRMLVTETLPMWIRSNETRTFTLDKLKNVSSSSLKHHKLTLEITSNPAWYAVQALPYLMEYPYDCNEQTFSRYYANALASHISNSNPRIQEVFNQWKGTDALLSNLEKNEELKSILIQETPWLRDAQSETEQKKRIALLFDLNKMNNELSSAMRKLKQNQLSNGAWPWFKGGMANRYITQHIISGFGHLKQLNVTSSSLSDQDQMIKKAIQYLDSEFVQEYHDLKKWNKNVDLTKDHLTYTQLHYLYMRSFFKDIDTSEETKDIMDYYYGQIKKYWLSRSLYSKGLMALIMHRKDDDAMAGKILKSLKETSITSEELGMYWKANTSSWYWYQAPIETQALVIEAFSEAGHIIQDETKNRETIDNLKIWLLKNKQTNQWKTTKATTEAVYALLLQGSDWLSVTDAVDVLVAKNPIDPTTLENVKVEAGTGYYKTAWNGNEVKSEMADVQLTKKGNGIAWGGLYWQYFEDLDKITSAETPLSLKKKLFLKKNTDTGEQISEITSSTKLEVGDLVRVRIELRSDRAMEFVHMKDMRAAGLEPVNVLSRYKWQDGLGYYESTKDASTNFFFDYLPKGVYVFEYDLRVNNAGDMSNGITTIQSMYAPEFTSHSEGVRISVE